MARNLPRQRAQVGSWLSPIVGRPQLADVFRFVEARGEAGGVRDPYATQAGQRGAEILVVTEDVSLVYGLRFGLAGRAVGVMWTNNFWVALAHLSLQPFASLIVDLSIGSVEPDFVQHFLEEYEHRGFGERIFMAAASAPPCLRRLLADRGARVLEEAASPERLMELLGLGSAGNPPAAHAAAKTQR